MLIYTAFDIFIRINSHKFSHSIIAAQTFSGVFECFTLIFRSNLVAATLRFQISIGNITPAPFFESIISDIALFLDFFGLRLQFPLNLVLEMIMSVTNRIVVMVTPCLLVCVSVRSKDLSRYHSSLYLVLIPNQN